MRFTKTHDETDTCMLVMNNIKLGYILIEGGGYSVDAWRSAVFIRGWPLLDGGL